MIALVLAALWLPVTLHCAMEAAIDAEFAPCAAACHEAGTEAGHDHEGEHRGSDGCEIVESGRYKAATDSVKVAPPVATLCACLLCVQAPEADEEAGPSLTAAESERPRDWVPAWHFVRRMAPVSRAPTI